MTIMLLSWAAIGIVSVTVFFIALYKLNSFPTFKEWQEQQKRKL